MKLLLLWWNKNILGDVTQRVNEAEDNIIRHDISLIEEWILEKNIELKILQAFTIKQPYKRRYSGRKNRETQ